MQTLTKRAEALIKEAKEATTECTIGKGDDDDYGPCTACEWNTRVVDVLEALLDHYWAGMDTYIDE